MLLRYLPFDSSIPLSKFFLKIHLYSYRNDMHIYYSMTCNSKSLEITQMSNYMELVSYHGPSIPWYTRKLCTDKKSLHYKLLSFFYKASFLIIYIVWEETGHCLYFQKGTPQLLKAVTYMRGNQKKKVKENMGTSKNFQWDTYFHFDFWIMWKYCLFLK